MKRRSRHMLAVLLLVVPLASALAQDIIVTAPRHRVMVRDPRTGERAEMVTTSAIVRIGDLDLRTEEGQREARRRVEAAARNVCEWLEELYPNDVPDTGNRECIRDAVRRGMDDVQAVSRIQREPMPG
jgi:UrcA family protein